MRTIDLKEWTLFSERLNSASYHNADKTLMLKLVHNVAKNSAEQEFLLASKAYACGLKTPRPVELVSYGGENGIIFEYIENKKSYTRACVEDPENTEYYMREWGKCVKRLHNTKCDTSVFPNMQEDVLNTLKNSDILPKNTLDAFIKMLEETENPGTFLLVDINPSNFIFSGDKQYIIDLNEICYGNPLLDLSFFYYLLFGTSDKTKNALDQGTSVKFDTLQYGWTFLLREYYETEDERVLAEKEAVIKSFAPIMGLNFISHMNLPQEFNDMMREDLMNCL